MAGLFANVEAIAMFFNTLNEGLADRLRWDGVALPCTAPANAETRPRDCLRDNFWGWGPLVGIGGWGDRATPCIQHIWIGGFPGCVADRYKISGQRPRRSKNVEPGGIIASIQPARSIVGWLG
jgi:hypothetical protein